MTEVELLLYVFILGSAFLAFFTFLFVRTHTASPRFLAACLFTLGLSLLAALGRYQYRLALFGIETRGVVTEIIPVRKGSRPVVSFTTTDGTCVETKCKKGSQDVRHELGQEVPLVYLQSDPTFAEVGSRTVLFKPLILGTIVSLVPLGLAVLVLRKDRWTRVAESADQAGSQS